MTHYDKTFYGDLENTALPSSEIIVPYLMKLVEPKSVIDFGCGTAWWLKTFKGQGAERIQGIDGPFVPDELLAIETKEILRTDMSNPIHIAERFDLSMSLEVAEHLPEAKASLFVDELCKAAPVVFFAAAIPGQGGAGHINEQWPGYWAAEFKRNGYKCFDIIRSRFWNVPNVAWWYKQNAFIYVSEEKMEAFQSFESVEPEDVKNYIHPELFASKLRYENPGFGKWSRMGIKAMRKSILKRF